MRLKNLLKLMRDIEIRSIGAAKTVEPLAMDTFALLGCILMESYVVILIIAASICYVIIRTTNMLCNLCNVRNLRNLRN